MRWWWVNWVIAGCGLIHTVDATSMKHHNTDSSTALSGDCVLPCYMYCLCFSVVWYFNEVFHVPLYKGRVRKGANSVCSFVSDVIMRENQTFRDVFLLSDGCTGQKCSWVVVTVLSALANDEKMNITHVFPVRGHSYCQCDFNFGLYSRAVKKMESVETVDDVAWMLRTRYSVWHWQPSLRAEACDRKHFLNPSPAPLLQVA